MKNKLTLLLIFVLTLIANSAFPMGSLPKAINTQKVEQFYETQVEHDPTTGIIKGAEPFYYQGTNKTAILLIHGLTGSPYEMKGLGEFLNQKGKPLGRPQAYKFLPLKSLSQMLTLNQFTRGELKKITAPALIIASHNDPVPDPKTFPFIMDHIVSGQKQLMMLEKSGHVVTEDIEKEVVFQEVAKFVDELSAREIKVNSQPTNNPYFLVPRIIDGDTGQIWPPPGLCISGR